MVAIMLNNLAQVLQSSNSLLEAESLLRRALAIDEHSYGSDHPNVAVRLSKLVGLLIVANRAAESESLMRRALFINEKCYGTADPTVGKDLNNLAKVMQLTNRYPEAVPLVQSALVIFRQSLGLEHDYTQIARQNLKWLLTALGMPEMEAEGKIDALLRGDNP